MDEMGLLLNRLEEISRQYGLKVNKSKTKIMIIDPGNIKPLNEKEHAMVKKMFKISYI